MRPPYSVDPVRVPPRPQPPHIPPDPEALPERPSKSQRKRDMTALQDLGEELVAQSRDFLDRAPLSERLREAIDEARRITDHEGRRRQMQFIGKLMREVDPEPIRAMLALTQRAGRRAAQHQHQLEAWRERLLESDGAFAQLGSVLGTRLDAVHLARLRERTEAAREERRNHRAPRHYRELFRELDRLFSTREEGA